MQAALAKLESEASLDAATVTSPAPDDAATGAEEVTIPPEAREAGGTIADPSEGDRVRYFGEYELLDEIARGGASGVDDAGLFPEQPTACSWRHGGFVPIWDVGNGQLTRTLAGFRGGFPGLAFTPDGTRLASGGLDKTIRLWDTATGREAFRLNGHKNWVMSLAFHPDGALLASGGIDEIVRIWDGTPLPLP